LCSSRLDAFGAAGRRGAAGAPLTAVRGAAWAAVQCRPRMAPRRPYASRGVSRRATIRRSGGAASTAGVAALGVVFAVIAAAIIWIANPFSASNPSGRLVPAGSGQSAGDPSAPFASLQTASEESSAAIGATPMAATTSRHWEASADGIVPDATLASRLDRALLGVDGQIGVAVTDLGRGRGGVVDGDLELA